MEDIVEPLVTPFCEGDLTHILKHFNGVAFTWAPACGEGCCPVGDEAKLDLAGKYANKLIKIFKRNGCSYYFQTEFTEVGNPHYHGVFEHRSKKSKDIKDEMRVLAPAGTKIKKLVDRRKWWMYIHKECPLAYINAKDKKKPTQNDWYLSFDTNIKELSTATEELLTKNCLPRDLYDFEEAELYDDSDIDDEDTLSPAASGISPKGGSGPSPEGAVPLRRDQKSKLVSPESLAPMTTSRKLTVGRKYA